ncbi:MAG: HEAT repeat domain-containing protein [Desulfobacteraceae bacterium]|jgi:HEAT repeat protein
MAEKKIVHLEPKDLLLQKATSYTECVERFLEERDTAVPLLLKALKYGDHDLRHEIMLLLGSFAKEEVATPLYEMLADPDEEEQLRHSASIQLSVIFPFLKDPQSLVGRLLKDIESEDPELRIHAAFALGWKGNAQAAIPLINLLYDPDTRVQQTAVNALSNLRDDRIFGLMLERLEHGPREQKRAILFNLWRFYSKKEEVASVYLKYLDHDDGELRFDALVLFGLVTDATEYISVYRRCLSDKNSRIRALALKELSELTKERLFDLKKDIEGMLSDADMEIKKTALKILKKLRGQN